MKQFIYTLLCLCFVALGYGQVKWVAPVSDSSLAKVTYTSRPVNSKHAVIVYTKTVTIPSLKANSDVIEQRAITTVTITTSASSYTYAVSVPTVTIKAKDLNTASGIIIYDIAGAGVFISTGNLTTMTGAVPVNSLQGGLTHLRLIANSAALAGIGPGIPDGVFPATFTVTGSATTYSVDVNYHVHDGNKIEFNIPDVKVPVPSVAGTSTLAVRSLTVSNTMTFSPAGIGLPGATVSNTFALSVNLYTLTPKAPETYTVPYTSGERNQLYEEHLFRSRPNAGIFYLSVGMIPSVLNRQVLVNTSSYDNYGFINDTKYHERSSYNTDLNAKIGVRIRRKTLVFLDVVYSNRGFKTGYDSINPFSGKTDVSVIAKNYKLNTLSFGLGYSFNWYHPERIMSPVFEMGMYASGDLNTVYDSPDVNRIRVGSKVCFGVALKPNNRHDFKIMPTFFYDFTTFVKNDISTRFYSFGLSVSYGIALCNYGKK